LKDFLVATLQDTYRTGTAPLPDLDLGYRNLLAHLSLLDGFPLPAAPAAVLAQAVAPYPDPAAFLKTALGGGFGQDSLAKLAGLDPGQRVSAASQLELQLMRGPAPLAAIGTPVIPRILLRPSQMPRLPAPRIRH
jgi:hypothetical protein